MDFEGLMFILSFLGIVYILGCKVYNAMNFGKIYDLSKGWLYFGGVLILWYILLAIQLTQPQKVIWHTLFNFTPLFLGLNVFTLALEIFFNFQGKFGTPEFKPYMSSEVKK